jgi:anti-sigma-K factor RskA
LRISAREEKIPWDSSTKGTKRRRNGKKMKRKRGWRWHLVGAIAILVSSSLVLSAACAAQAASSCFFSS